jgi:ureidoglycolate lyase
VNAPGPHTLRVEPLTHATFAAFGDVIDVASAETVYTINEGTAQRFHDLARIDTGADRGHPIVSLFRAQARALPFVVRMLERHPLGSQGFMPLGPHPYLVVVSESLDTIPRAFLAQPGQGVNLHRGVWHHPLLALDATSDFLVIDRGGPGANCDEVELAAHWRIDRLDA